MCVLIFFIIFSEKFRALDIIMRDIIINLHMYEYLCNANAVLVRF
jgi:hypothetical protein